MATAGQCVVPSPQHYAWWFPGSPIKVHLDLQLVQRMHEHLRSAKPGAPHEGVLFGKASAGVTQVLAFRPALNGNVANLLSEAEKESRDLAVVGYYRTEPGDTLRLNEKDLSLAGLFPKPHQVFLLLQMSGFGPPNAAFFFHEGDRFANFAFLDFPFDASELANQERDRILRSQQSVAEQTAAPLPLATLTPANPESHRTAVWIWLAGLLLACGVGLALTWSPESGFRLAGRSRQPSPVPAAVPGPIAPPQPTSTFGLQVSRHDNDVKLNWNRQSPLVSSATSATLLISDGGLARKIPLTGAQVRNGSIVYAPTNSEIQLQLTIATPRESMSESVLIILPQRAAPQVQNLTRPVKPETTDSVPLKPFTPPVLPRRSNLPGPSVSLESPPVPAVASGSAPPLPAVLLQSVVPPRVPPSPPSAAPAPQTRATFYPPEVTRSVAAVYPSELKSLNLQPRTVEVKVALDQNGRVVKTEYLPNKEGVHASMVQSALTAVGFCRFKPARLGNRAVAGELILQFMFKQPN